MMKLPDLTSSKGVSEIGDRENILYKLLTEGKLLPKISS